MFMKRSIKRSLCVLLAAAMLFGMLPLCAVQVKALTPTYSVSSAYKATSYYSKLCDVKLTGNQRDDIINVALSQVGYVEGSSSGDYGGADDGSYLNYVEYNYWYNKCVSSGMPVGGSYAHWCATFVSWCAEQAGVPKSILNRSTAAGHSSSYFNIYFYSGSSTLNASSDDNYHFLGYNYTPKKGDLFYTRTWSHVGLVVGVNGSYVTTVEGNTNDGGSADGMGVYRRTRAISSLYFGVPEYVEGNPQPPSKPTLNAMQATYPSGSNVPFTWSETQNTTQYNLTIQKQVNGVYTTYGQDDDVSSGYRLNLEDGAYRAAVISVNTNASDNASAQSDWVYFMVGSHQCDRGSFAYSQSAHPHYNCYTCSLCGSVWTDTTETGYDSSCASCQRPGKPSLVGISAFYAENEDVTFSWQATPNTTHYDLDLYVKNSQGGWTSYEKIGYATSGITRQLKAGEYKAVLHAVNSAAYESNGSGWCSEASEEACFSVISTGYKVTYDSNGGICSVTTQNVAKGSAIGEMPEPMKPGSRFLGWFNAAGGQVVSTTIINGNITLYAKWGCGHDGLRMEAYKAPTCMEAGTEAYQVCVVCGQTLKMDGVTETSPEAEILAPLGHNMVTTVKNPTCVNAGMKTIGCTRCTYSINEPISATGHNYTNGKCANCGAADPNYSAGVTKPTLTLKSPTLEFKDMISITAFYTAENVQDVVEMGMITYDEKVTTVSVTTADFVIPGATYVESTGRYYSSSQGIAAKYLADTVYLAIYAKLSDGSYAYSKLAPYSAITYANSQLKNSTDVKLKQLVVAMLNYGAKAQLHFNHNTGSLATAALTADQLALPAAYNSGMVSSVPSAPANKQGIFANNQGFAKRTPSISFEGAFCINYFFTPKYAPDSGITMYYWTAEDYNAASVLTTSNATGKIKLEGSGTGQYQGDIEGIAAKALSEAVYVACAYKSGGTVWTSGVLGYSIGAYCSGQSTKAGTIADLAKATAVYGYHAKQYFG